MTGLDTNVLLEWLFAGTDLPDLDRDPPFQVSLVVLAELIWVLGRTMKRPRGEVVATVAKLLGASNIRFEHPEIVGMALEDFAEGPADFPDYLLMRDNERAGCATTLTLDRRAARHPGFTLLKDGD